MVKSEYNPDIQQMDVISKSDFSVPNAHTIEKYNQTTIFNRTTANTTTISALNMLSSQRTHGQASPIANRMFYQSRAEQGEKSQDELLFPASYHSASIFQGRSS